MKLSDLTINFKHLKQKEILSDWQWLIGKRRHPILISVIGDAFVQDEKTFEVFFLNTAIAGLISVASSSEDFQNKLANPEFVEDYMPPSVIAMLNEKLGKLAHGELYGFKVPPFLGGQAKSENMERTNIEVHFSMFGQLARQIKSVPDGTKITSIKCEY